MSHSNFYELYLSLITGSVETVKSVLESSVNRDPEIREVLRIGEILHWTDSVGILETLLLHGAYVDGKNEDGETPLHAAVGKSNGLELVKLFLKFGASVNSENNVGKTPLNLAIKNSLKNMNIIKELLTKDAKINPKRLCHPFDVCHKKEKTSTYVLFKMFFLKFLRKDCEEITPDPALEDSESIRYPLSRYVDDCVSEILQMSLNPVCDKLSLHQFLFIENLTSKVMHDVKNKLLAQESIILNMYPIYYDIIMTKVSSISQREHLLNKVDEIVVYTILKETTEAAKPKKVVLNDDSVLNLSKYLSNSDLANFITAFIEGDENIKHMEKLLKDNNQMQKRIEEKYAINRSKRRRNLVGEDSNPFNNYNNIFDDVN